MLLDRRDLKEEKHRLTVRVRELEDETKLAADKNNKLSSALELATYVGGGDSTRDSKHATSPTGTGTGTGRKSKAITGGKEVPTLPALIAEVANLKIKEENARKKADRLQDLLDKTKVTRNTTHTISQWHGLGSNPLLCWCAVVLLCC